VLEVAHEVILDREHRIRPGFLDYVQYECRNDFPGRIEVLATTEQDEEREPASVLLSAIASEDPVRAADEQHLGELAVNSEPETERMSETEASSEPDQVNVERQSVRNQGGWLATLLGRRE
jgi:hypothetical protein